MFKKLDDEANCLVGYLSLTWILNIASSFWLYSSLFLYNETFNSPLCLASDCLLCTLSSHLKHNLGGCIVWVSTEKYCNSPKLAEIFSSIITGFLIKT